MYRSGVMVPMNTACSWKGFEKVCGTPIGTTTTVPASTSTESWPLVNRTLPAVTIKTSSCSWCTCCAGCAGPAEGRLDEAQAVPGMGAVLDDARADRPAAGLPALAGPNHT